MTTLEHRRGHRRGRFRAFGSLAAATILAAVGVQWALRHASDTLLAAPPAAPGFAESLALCTALVLLAFALGVAWRLATEREQ